ncbi:uncharacterized protein THITE_2127199 [Thermothielavioides terrestris NRRL 8126]|uniref:Kelch repeat protein n=2 Tax=Thermothielavioides terrestris TaxID=2587410 RepID=G2R1W1_THETT|nr:uncharacterized protein THITE_2127199 [Thermothielavioides terrestris NRRL 8126]AEO64937.1 hypothetical protein THITE_2127199 [Thermothielavioides terrestris NRRL 8126]
MRSEGSPWGLLVALLGSVAAAGLSDVPSPENYLRKATASATLIGNYVYIDGGEIAQLVDGKVPSFRTTNQVNSTLSIDMSKSWNASTVVQRTIDRPWWSKVNQVIWTNHEAGTFYVWGGKWIWGDNMTKNELWKFTPDGKGAGTWSIEPPANADLFNGLHESEFGAYANTNDTGFVIGGIASGWTEYGRASTSVLPGMVTFNMQTNVWQNGTTAFSPFGTLAGARAHYIPTFGPNGLVMVLGGQSHSLVGDPDWSAATPYDLRNLTFFDPQTKKQYWQATTGSIPPFPRTFFCLAGFQNTDGGYEILLAGGSNERDKFLYQDTYILSLPGFVWVKAADSPSGKRRDAACVSVGNRQVLSIGGTDGTWTDPDPAPQGLQLFDMTEMQWKYSYDANAAAYERPADLAVWYKNG